MPLCGRTVARRAQKEGFAWQLWLGHGEKRTKKLLRVSEMASDNQKRTETGRTVRLEGKRRKRSAGLAKRFLDFARNDKQSARNDKQKLAIPLSPLSYGRSCARWGRSGRLRRRLRERRWDIRRYCRTFLLHL